MRARKELFCNACGKKIQMEKPQGGYRDLEIKRTIKTYQEEAYVKS